MRIKLAEGAIKPTRSTDHAGAYDLYAYIDEMKDLRPGEVATISTGVFLEIPIGQVGLIFTRSGNGCNRGVKLRNQVGVIDADYRGDILVTLENRGSEPFIVEPEQRFAQILFTHTLEHTFEVVPELNDTKRGGGGHGSTGS